MMATIYETVLDQGAVKQRVRATVSLNPLGSLRIEEYGEGEYTKDILAQRICLPSGAVVTSEDGADFVRALPYAYNGSRVRAVVQED
jgi:hypothetical protein